MHCTPRARAQARWRWSSSERCFSVSSTTNHGGLSSCSAQPPLLWSRGGRRLAGGSLLSAAALYCSSLLLSTALLCCSLLLCSAALYCSLLLSTALCCSLLLSLLAAEERRSRRTEPSTGTRNSDYAKELLNALAIFLTDYSRLSLQQRACTESPCTAARYRVLYRVPGTYSDCVGPPQPRCPAAAAVVRSVRGQRQQQQQIAADSSR